MTNMDIISENDNSTVITEYTGLNNRNKSYTTNNVID